MGADITPETEIVLPPATASLSPTQAAHVRQLAATIGHLAAAMRGVAVGRALSSFHVAESLYEARGGLSRVEERKDGEEVGDEGGVLSQEATCLLSYALENITTALEHLAGGAALSDTETMRQLLFADAQLTEAVRLVPEAEFRGAIRAVWGREEAPVRLR